MGKPYVYSNRSRLGFPKNKDDKSYISKMNETFFTHQDSIYIMHDMLNDKLKDIETKMEVKEKTSSINHSKIYTSD